MTPLTHRQLEIFLLIKHWIAAHGMSPTRAEISRHFEFKSANAAECHLRAIAVKGWISLTPGISRGIRISQPAEAPV